MDTMDTMDTTGTTDTTNISDAVGSLGPSSILPQLTAEGVWSQVDVSFVLTAIDNMKNRSKKDFDEVMSLTTSIQLLLSDPDIKACPTKIRGDVLEKSGLLLLLLEKYMSEENCERFWLYHNLQDTSICYEAAEVWLRVEGGSKRRNRTKKRKKTKKKRSKKKKKTKKKRSKSRR